MMKMRRREKWWFHAIRGMNLWAFRYWWLFLLLFVGAIALFYYQCCPEKEENCAAWKTAIEKTRLALDASENCCNCGAIEIWEDAEEIVIDDEVEEIDDLRREYGGCVGDVTVTLRWSTKDDLDLHLLEPNGDSINFQTYVKPRRSQYGGTLDVDKNAGTSQVENPIENICYINTPPPGVFTVQVHFYSRKSIEREIPYQVLVQVGEETKVYQGIHRNVHEMHRICDFNPR